MSNKDLRLSYLSVTPFSLQETRQKHRAWSVMFDHYNENHEKKVGMGCTPCYAEVYRFVREELKKENAVS